MKAAVLREPGPVEGYPLEIREMPIPTPSGRQVRIRVHACGICRTDLHVVEGELAPLKQCVIPGHQIVGVIDACGPNADRYAAGARVGVAWLHRTCGVCTFCRSGRENLCDSAAFTGYSVDGGYAEYVLAEEDFVYRLPEGFSEMQAAPLLCAGIIGYRCLKMADLSPGEKLGIYGFGAAGHVCIQVAQHREVSVFVSTRESKHRELATQLGAAWTGGSMEPPPERLDAAIIFAPAGELVPAALACLKKGGRLVLGGIHMSDIPPIPYRLVYHERSIRSVANNTRTDGEEFLELAARIPIRTQVQTFALQDANSALHALKHDGIKGAEVLQFPEGRRRNSMRGEDMTLPARRNESPETAEAHLETSRLRINRILLATDFSESAERARKWAVALSRSFGSKLFLLNAMSPVTYLGETGMDPAIVQQASVEAANAHMAKLTARPEMRGLEKEEIIVLMPPVEAVQRAAEMHKIDLVVMGSHGAGGLAKLAMGSVAEAAVRHSPAPVVIVGPKCEVEPKAFDSVLLATDLGMGSLRPAQYAAAMAAENDGKITVLHVLPEGEQDATIRDEMKRRMDSLLPADAALWSRPSLRVEHGAPEKQILEVAEEEKVNLIVVGTREAGPLSDHAPWSTLSRIIRGARCPVMAVRAHAEV